MNLSKNILMSVIILFITSSVAYAADVTVIWQNPQNYTDVKGGLTPSDKVEFVNKIFTSIEREFEVLAARLPKNQKLYIQVMNVDLAGRAWSSTPHRTIGQGGFPRFLFTYILQDENGVVISQERVSLKDMHFLDSTIQLTSKFLTYEKRMIKKWFIKEFKEQVTT